MIENVFKPMRKENNALLKSSKLHTQRSVSRFLLFLRFSRYLACMLKKWLFHTLILDAIKKINNFFWVSPALHTQRPIEVKHLSLKYLTDHIARWSQVVKMGACIAHLSGDIASPAVRDCSEVACSWKWICSFLYLVPKYVAPINAD